MENVEIIIADGDEPLKPAMYLQDAQYEAALDKMLSAVAKDLSSRAVFAERSAGELARCSGKEEAWLESTNSPSVASITAAIPSFATTWHEFHHWSPGVSSLADDNPLATVAVVMAGNGSPYANQLNIGVTLDRVDGGFP
ncbi:hypothetical protein F5X98DRAFT_378961 [Xylaria grammica]|nr:hypothetical protein F5X98DRAFT_378961 [Xylaria grammica]